MKRTLAILLATLMTLGVFAIGASAATSNAMATTSLPGLSTQDINGSDDGTGTPVALAAAYEVSIYDTASATPAVALTLPLDLEIDMILEAKIAKKAAYASNATVPTPEVSYLWFAAKLDPAWAGAPAAPSLTIADFTKVDPIVVGPTFAVQPLDVLRDVFLVVVLGADKVKLGQFDQVIATEAIGNIVEPTAAGVYSAADQAVLDPIICKMIEENVITISAGGVTITSKVYAALEPFVDDLAAEVAALNAAIKAFENPPSGATAGQLAVLADNAIKAAKALDAAAKKLINKNLANAKKLLDEYIADLEAVLANANLPAGERAAVRDLLLQAQELAYDYGRLVAAFGDDLTDANKLTLAKAFIAKVDYLAGVVDGAGIVEYLKQLGKDTEALAAAQAALAKAQADLAAAQAALDAATGDKTALQAAVDALTAQVAALQKIIDGYTPVIIEPKWYDLGIYKILGVGGWSDLLQTIMYYVFFGWRFGAK